MFFIYIVSILLILVICTFIPFFLILRKIITHNYLDNTELLVLTPVISLAAFGYLAFTNYILNTNQTLNNISFLILICFLAIITKSKKSVKWVDLKFLFAPFCLLILLFLGLQSLIKLYTGAFSYGDWYMHYEISQFYLLHKPLSTSFIGQVYFVPSRTPFFNLICAFFLSIFKNNFYTFQVISYFLNSLFILPLILIYKKYINSRYGLRFLVIFCLINPYIYYRITLTTPKFLTAFFFLCGLYFYLKIRNTKKENIKHLDIFFSGLFLGITVLCHSSFVFYVIGLYIDFLILKLKKKTFLTWLDDLYIFFIFSLTLIPWLIWLFMNFKLSVILGSSPTALLTANKSLMDWVIQHFANSIFTLFPFGLIWGIIKFAQCRINTVSFVNMIQGTYIATVPGILSFSLAFLLLSRILQKKYKDIICLLKENQLYVILITIGFIGSILPEPTWYLIGLAHNSLDISFLLILLLTVKYIFNKPLKKLAFVIIIFENLLITWGFVLYQIFYNNFRYLGPQKNLILKTSNHVIYIFDTLGSYWLLLLIITLLLQIFIIRKYKRELGAQS